MLEQDRISKVEFAEQMKEKEIEKEKLLRERNEIRMQLKQKRRTFGEIQSFVKSVGKLKETRLAK